MPVFMQYQAGDRLGEGYRPGILTECQIHSEVVVFLTGKPKGFEKSQAAMRTA